MSELKLKPYLRIALLLCGLLALLLAFDLAPILRGGFGWQWRRVLLPASGLPAFGGLLLWMPIYLFVSAKLLRAGSGWLLVGWAGFASIVMTVLVVLTRMPDLFYGQFASSTDPVGLGWYNAAILVRRTGTLQQVLADYPTQMFRFRGAGLNHLTTSPPGHWLMYYLFSEALGPFPALAEALAAPLRALACLDAATLQLSSAELASAWIGITTPFWGLIAAALIYLFGRALGSEQGARWAVIPWALMPSLLMFNPYPSAIFVVISLAAMGSLALGLERESRPWVFVGGVFTSLATFTNFIFLPLGFMAGALALLFYFARRESRGYDWGWPFVQGAVFATGLSVVWGIYYLYSAVTPLDVFRASMDWHLNLDLPYLPWVFLHVNDYALFLGWPLMALTGRALFHDGRRYLAAAHRVTISGAGLLALGCAAMIVVLDISGMARGESGRSWIIFTPFLLIGLGEMLASAEAGQDQHWLWGAFAAQAATTLLLIGLLQPMAAYSPDLAQQYRSAALPADLITRPVEATFGDTLRLRAFTGRVEADGLRLWLEWDSSAPPERRYWLSILPVGPDGEPGLAMVVPPFGDGDPYPVTCWFTAPGLVTESLTSLPEDAAGDWWISLSLIDPQTGDLLPLANGDTQIGLGPFPAQ